MIETNDAGGGEDERSTEDEGDHSHLHDGQKSPAGPSGGDDPEDPKTKT